MIPLETTTVESVEAFAALCAGLDDPFADRAALLASARLDERGFAELQEQWATKLGTNGEDVRARFAAAYSAARARGPKAIVTTSEAPEPPREEEIPPTARAVTPPDKVPVGGSPSAPASPPALELPSFMKADAPEPTAGRPAAAPTVAPQPAIAPPRREPLSTETGAIDVSELLKATVPFAPDAPSKMAVATVPHGPIEKAPRHESTETVEFDLSALLKERGPMPFQKPVARPKTLPLPIAGRSGGPESPVAPSPAAPQAAASVESMGVRRRLIRFDPQTGTPLLTPYWEELSDTDRKK